jgi:hypothetical protein
MKLYQVVMSYFDGDHDHGSYRSPLFAHREHAEQFMKYVTAEDTPDCYRWESYYEHETPFIETIEVFDAPVEVKEYREYLEISYT